MFVGLKYVQFFLLLVLSTSWISDNAELPILEIRTTQINQTLMNPDAQSILMASGSQILVWDIYKKQILQRYSSVENDVTTMSLSRDGLWLVAGHENGDITLWDANTFEVAHHFSAHKANITTIHVHSPGFIASGDQDGHVKIWDLATAQMQKSFNAHDAAITALDISANEQMLLTASTDSYAKLWTLNDDKTEQKLVGHLSSINTACFLNESTVLTGSDDKTITAWNLQTGEIAYTLLGHSNGIIGIKALPGQGRFASSSIDGETIIWDNATMKEMDRMTMKNTKFQQVDIHNNKLLGLHTDQSISLWNLSEQKKTQSIQISSTPVLSGHLSNSKEFIITGDETGTIKKHQLSNGDLIQLYPGHKKAINVIVESPDGKTYATAADDKLIKLWDSHTGELLQTFEGHKSSVLSLSYSIDGQFLYSGGKDKLIKWWNISSGIEINSFKAHGSDITKLIPLEDSNVLSVSKDRMVRIHSVEKGNLNLEIKSHPFAISSATYISKDSLLYIGDIAGNISSYHMGQQTMSDHFKGHTGKINHLRLSEDFTYLLSSSDDKTANLWHLPSKTLEHTFSGHTAPLSYCSFGKDETSIITTSLDKQIKIWSVQKLVQR